MAVGIEAAHSPNEVPTASNSLIRLGLLDRVRTPVGSGVHAPRGLSLASAGCGLTRSSSAH